METGTSLVPQSCQDQQGLCGVDAPKTASSSEKPHSNAAFSHWKLQASQKMDLSKKGSVDKDIEETVRQINLQPCYFTTSSCSGRIIIIEENSDHSVVQKENCSWLFVTHDLCGTDDVNIALQKASGDGVLKFEPFVLHVQCRTLEDAQLLGDPVQPNNSSRDYFQNTEPTSTSLVYLESTMWPLTLDSETLASQLAKRAVRSTHCLEVPLSHKGKCLVSNEFIEYLVQTANQKMEENKKRIARFFNCLQAALKKRDMANSVQHKAKSDNAVYTRRRRRGEVSEKVDHDPCIDLLDDPETSISFLHDTGS